MAMYKVYWLPDILLVESILEKWFYYVAFYKEVYLTKVVSLAIYLLVIRLYINSLSA